MAISGKFKTRAVSKRYPPTSGLVAETTKTAGRQINLVPERGSFVSRERKKGL